MPKKVFLGGTVNNSTWREALIPQLQINYFNPVVADWNDQVQQEEIRQRKTCDFVLYTITKEMLGFYAIAEVVDDSNKRPNKTIFCYLEVGFEEHQIKSLQAIARMVKENGAQVFTSLEGVAEWLNGEGLKGKTISHEENLGNNSQENYEAIELTNCEQPEVEEQEIVHSSTITQQQFVFENNQKVFPFPIWLVRMFCCG